MSGSVAGSSSGSSSAPRSPIPTNGWQGALPRLARVSIEEVLSAVGRGEMSRSRRRACHVSRLQGRARCHRCAAAEAGKRLVRAQEAKSRSRLQGADGRAGAAIPIRGINSDLPVRFAPNGGAVPGDRIVGILTPGEGITIYPIQSPALKDFEDAPENWLDLRWDVEERTPQRFPARIVLQTVNEPDRLPRSPRSSPSTTATSTISAWSAHLRISPRSPSISRCSTSSISTPSSRN